MARIDLGSVVGPQGQKGDTGATGNGIASITVTESQVDGGNNVVKVNMTDNTSKQFNVKNGTKGSKGDTGATGATGPQGETGAAGISPTFVIQGGHLYADYDNPYNPNA